MYFSNHTDNAEWFVVLATMTDLNLSFEFAQRNSQAFKSERGKKEGPS